MSQMTAPKISVLGDGISSFEGYVLGKQVLLPQLCLLTPGSILRKAPGGCS